jgi:hypothetical protein
VYVKAHGHLKPNEKNKGVSTAARLWTAPAAGAAASIRVRAAPPLACVARDAKPAALPCHRTASNSRARARQQVVLNAFTVRPVTNFNELTYHYLRTIFEHLHITRGGAGMGGQVRACCGAAGTVCCRPC